MAKRLDIVVVELTREQISLCKENTKEAVEHGFSHFPSHFRGKDDRQERIWSDQYTAQFCNAAFAIWLLGEEEGLDLYHKTRLKVQENPTESDGGTDLLGYQIDVKGRWHWDDRRRIYKYELPIRPTYYPGTCYVLAVADYGFRAVHHGWDALVTVHLNGWEVLENFPEEPETEGTFKGARLIRSIGKLHPMEDLHNCLHRFTRED